MAAATDEAGIQFRILNASKGPAVRATRAQADRILYRAAIRRRIENQPNLWLFQQAVDDLILEGDRVAGAVTQVGIRFAARAVVLTAGTFLDGRIHVGLQNHAAGRAGDPPALSLSLRLKELALPQGRLKTGTPPRIDGRSIAFDRLEEQPGDTDPVPVFSFMGDASQHPRQVPCWITHTNERTHEIIRSGFDRSPMFTGVIEGIGPRYCPSIEDKVNRFADKASHQIFLEPEGLTTNEFYPNGISTSLPFDVQLAAVRSMRGLEDAHILRPGYAIEYDFFDPRALRPSLETRTIEGLFFAGQINGTTGYEEAAAQGLFAGLNAALKVRDHDAWVPGRDQAYLGVLVDDLTTKGVNEPYRMFTSRAEYRLQLREDNAPLVSQPGVSQLVPQPLDHLLRLGQVGGGQEDGELVAAVAGKQVTGAQRGPAQRADPPQGFVTGQVAVGVVDVLELIQVEQHQGEGFAVAAGAGQLVLGQVEKVAAVMRLGQVVGGGEQAQAVFGLLELVEQAQLKETKQRGDDGRDHDGDGEAGEAGAAANEEEDQLSEHHRKNHRGHGEEQGGWPQAVTPQEISEHRSG